MKTTIKLSIFLLIFASFSCSVNTEKESILPQNTAITAANSTKSARTNPIVNTIVLISIKKGQYAVSNMVLVSFGSENINSKKEEGGRHTPFHNFVLDENGTILTELSPDEIAPGNPLFSQGNPIGGIMVKGGKNPGGLVNFELKTDDNGEVILPADLEDGDYTIKIEIGAAGSIVFDMTIGNERLTPKIAKESHGRISNVDAPNMLVNKDGTIRNFYYEEDFQLHNDIAKYLGVEKIVIEKGYYRVGQNKWGNVTLRVKNGGKITGSVIINNGNLRFFEGTNPKGIDCKGFGIACFYNAETGIDKKDILYYVVKPIIEKGILIGVEISEGKKGLNAVNVKLA